MIRVRVWIRLLIFYLTAMTIGQSLDPFTYNAMKCAYGERGSLTATCYNATPSFFKNTLYKFDHLDETLRCINCSLKSIEPSTFDLSGNQIKHLDLRSSSIEVLKQRAFIGLIFLETLDLSDNKIRSVYLETFTGVRKINKVDLSRNRLTILSENGFRELVNLKTLVLSNNSIEMLDFKAFNGLSNLENLDLSYNRISSVRSEFSNLTALQAINLENNSIRNLNGSEFYDLKNLLDINLSHNLISTPMISIAPGGQVKSLNMAFNNITKITADYLKIDTLEVLNLRKNAISTLDPKCFSNVYTVNEIDLSFNNLRQFRTATYTGLPMLRQLNCSHNKIADVTIVGVFSLQSLHYLDLSYNELVDFNYWALISRMPKLAYLSLKQNPLPCQLALEMEKFFMEDNFKFSLFNDDKEPVCPEAKGKELLIWSPERAPKETERNDDDSTTATDVVLFVILFIMSVAVGVLYYFEYQAYRSTKGMTAATSTVRLLEARTEPREEDNPVVDI